MSPASFLNSMRRSFEVLVLSGTAHARLSRASAPEDYDEILKRTIREVKFHSETLLSILFFMGTTSVEPYLISWTLACLLFTLLTYTALEAMSGTALHAHIDTLPIPHARALLALLAKLPALGTLGTLCALARTAWDTPLTRAVLAALAVALVLWITHRQLPSLRSGVCACVGRVRALVAGLRLRFSAHRRPRAVSNASTIVGDVDEKLVDGFVKDGFVSEMPQVGLPVFPLAAALV